MSAEVPDSKRAKTHIIPSTVGQSLMASTSANSAPSSDDEDIFGSGSDSESNDLSDDYFSDSDVGETLSEVLRVTCRQADDILQEIDAGIQKIHEVSGLSKDQAAIVSSHHGWATDQILERVCENPERVLSQAGAALPETSESSCCETSCCVCDDEADLETPLPCGHAACKECYGTYLKGKVQEGFSHQITCIGYGCNLRIGPAMVSHLTDVECMHKYNKLLVDAFVDARRQLKWCPTPSCSTAVQKQFSAHTLNDNTVVCGTCEHPFCFDCGVYHLPANCKMHKDFTKLCEKDGGNVAWLSSNAKECPKCSAYIEKNGGCNWIKCGKCKFEFCWLCGRHMLHREVDAAGGNHKCNVFKEGEEEEISAREKARRRRQKEDDRLRFAHFFKRVKAHDESRKLESELKVKMPHPSRIEQAARRDLFRHVDLALSTLFEARLALRSSYVLAYYNKWPEGTGHQAIFEDLQHLLENRTEALSKGIEDACRMPEASTPEESGEAKSQVLANTDAVKHNLKSLISSVQAYS